MSESIVIEVVRKTVTVDCTVEEAFRVFTADALSWWPVDTHSIHQSRQRDRVRAARRRRGLRGGGVRRAWPLGDGARVGAAEPPRPRLEHPRARPGDATEVEVRFLPDGDGTRVELEHRGWENVERESVEKRENYDSGWDVSARRSTSTASSPTARGAHETSEAARPTGRRRSLVTSTEGRRAMRHRASAPAARARGARETPPGTRPCRRTR